MLYAIHVGDALVKTLRHGRHPRRVAQVGAVTLLPPWPSDAGAPRPSAGRSARASAALRRGGRELDLPEALASLAAAAHQARALEHPRCLVTAWRDTRGPQPAARSSPVPRSQAGDRRKRVSSPSAANSGAAAPPPRPKGEGSSPRRTVCAVFWSCSCQPSVHAVRLGAALGGIRSKPDSTTVSRVPAATSSSRTRPASSARWVVMLRVDRVGMPAEREQALGLHALHHHLERHMLVAGFVMFPSRAPEAKAPST